MARCRYCLKPRPSGYSVTCGGSACQEQAYRDAMAQARPKRRTKKKGGR